MSETATMKVDGQPVTDQQFQEIVNNPNVKLVEIAPGEYKTLQKMEG